MDIVQIFPLFSEKKKTNMKRDCTSQDLLILDIWRGISFGS